MKKLFPTLLILVFAIAACKKEAAPGHNLAKDSTSTKPVVPVTTQVTVTGMAPATGPAGTVITITGTNFTTSGSSVTVAFNGTAASIQSVSATEIKVTAPAVGTSGQVTVNVGPQSIAGPAFTYTSVLTSSYTGGEVHLTTQAQVDAFVAQNTGRSLQLSGALMISGNDISDVSGLSLISSVSGSVFISACPLLTEVSFLNNLTSVNALFLQNLNIAAITMDKIVSLTGNLTISGCKNLKTVSFKALTTIKGNAIFGSVGISGCPQLTDVDLSALTSAESYLNISGTAIIDLSKFSALRTAGSLGLSNNPALTSLHGLEHLTTLTSPAIVRVLNGVIITGLKIAGNTSLRTLDGLQSLTTVPVISITGNAELEGFCPLRTVLNTLSSLTPYTYQATTSTDNVYKTVSVPALTLTGNGSYATTRDAVASLALCR